MDATYSAGSFCLLVQICSVTAAFFFYFLQISHGLCISSIHRSLMKCGFHLSIFTKLLRVTHCLALVVFWKLGTASMTFSLCSANLQSSTTWMVLPSSAAGLRYSMAPFCHSCNYLYALENEPIKPLSRFLFCKGTPFSEQGTPSEEFLTYLLSFQMDLHS